MSNQSVSNRGLDAAASDARTAPAGAMWLRVRQTAHVVMAWLRSGPVSVVLALLLIAVYVVSLMVGRAALEPHLSAGVGHGWWTAFTAFSWARGIARLLIECALVLTAGVGLERLLGSRWLLITAAVTSSLGAALTIGTVRMIDAIDHQWGAVLERQEVFGSIALLIGVASAASIKLPAVWRRRMRIEVGTILLMMVIFSGTVGTLLALITALLGWLWGFALWGRQRDPSPAVAKGPQNARILIALVASGIVVGTLVSLHWPGMIGALVSLRYSVSDGGVLPPLVDHICDTKALEAQCGQYQLLLSNDYLGRRILAIVPLLLQLILAWGLYRGRSVAWHGTMILQGVSAVVATWRLVALWTGMHAWNESAVEMGFNQRGHPAAQIVVPIVVPLIMMVIVGANRSLFRVRAAEGVYRRLWRNLGWVTLGTWVLTLAIGAVQAAIGGRLGSGSGSALALLTGLRNLTVDFLFELLPSSVLSVVTPGVLGRVAAMGPWASWTPLIPWAALSIMLWNSFQTQYLPGLITRDEYVRILKSAQGGSMSWSGTWTGNYYWKSRQCEAAIAYRVAAGVALTVSDPAAREEDMEQVLTEFAGFCQEQGLVPALYSVHPGIVRVTDSWDWTRLRVAEDTVLDLPGLEFKGKKFQDIRTALNRAEKEGIHTEWTTFDQASPAILAQIKQISADWLAAKALPEMGFTIGGLAELDDPEVRILVAVDQEGTVHGVTSWMPVYDRGRIKGWILDFMRRLDGGFRPVMEYLIASAALWAKEEGYEILSLSGAPLAKAEPVEPLDEVGAASQGSITATLDQLLDFMSRSLEPVYGFHSLLNFKAKFDPEYVPMYLVIPTVTSLPLAGIALLRVFLPGLGLSDAMKLGLTLRQK